MTLTFVGSAETALTIIGLIWLSSSLNIDNKAYTKSKLISKVFKFLRFLYLSYILFVIL